MRRNSLSCESMDSIDSRSYSIESHSNKSHRSGSRTSSFDFFIEDISDNNLDEIIKNNKKTEANKKIETSKNIESKKRTKRRSRDQQMNVISSSPNINDFIHKLFIFNNKHK